MLKVLIVDDQKTIQEVLISYLEGDPGIEIVGVADDGQKALTLVEELRPNIVLMDIDMPALDGLTTTRIISERFVETQILILSVHDEDSYLNTALQVGAKGYLLKNTPAKELINAIYSAYKGYFQLGPGLLEKYLYKISQSQSNLAEVEQMKTMMFQQAKLLEEMKNVYGSNQTYTSNKTRDDKYKYNQRYIALEKQFYSLQYQLEKINKQIAYLQTFCFLISTAFVIVLFVIIMIDF